MTETTYNLFNLSEADLEFVVNTAAPGADDKEHLKRLVQKDEAFRKTLVGDEKVFQRAMADEELFLKISPPLYFELLLRRALKDLEVATHTVERTGKQRIPVFDVRDVVGLLGRSEVLDYLVQMLASFIRIHSQTVVVRVRKGIRRRVRYNDMDIDSLMHFAGMVDEEHRFAYYKRIADACLFVTGVFPEYVFYDYRYPGSEQVRPAAAGRLRRSLEEYEETGRRFYGLAERHPTAHILRLSEVFGLLREHFVSARKPLEFMSTHYLHAHRRQLFGFLPQ
ncbi:MAG: hypothetical protein V3S37_00900 [Dehalococcoidia bacterium]